jgi:hypothetical protein
MNGVNLYAFAISGKESASVLRMRSTGLELQQARERAGLSADDIAARTKFKLCKIDALERSDFARLPHGIYLDGIVRAYARELALDPEPLVERLRLERGKLPGDSPIPFEEPVEFERPVVVHAVPATPLVPRAPEHAARAHSSMAFALLALLALLGWGAYFYQAIRAAEPDTAGKSYMVLPAHAAPGAAPIAFTDAAVADAPESADDVTGSWKLATQVESSSVARYEGLLLGYELQLEQDGDRISGIGRKMIENGSRIDAPGQTPIAVTGIADGERLTLSFVEAGARRATQGTFMLTHDADGMLRGRFTSDAASSAGSVEARRVR